MRTIWPCLTCLLILAPCSASLADQPKPKAATSAHRRLLGICVCQYLYLPTVSYDSDTAGNVRVDFGALLGYLGRTLKIPEAQIHEVSDCALGKKRIAPTHEAMEQVIGQFLGGSRTSDQVVLMFVGHEVELAGVVYLVPLDGDLTNPASMISLDSLLKRLEACPARQKVLIVDVNRFDPIRGMAHAQPMSQKVEAALKNPPKGVQVWSACSAGQFSLKVREPRKFEGRPIQGGLFQSLLQRTFLLDGEDDLSADGALPLGKLFERLDSDLSRALPAIGLGRFKQTSFLAGEIAENGPNADGDKPAPPLRLPVWPADAVPPPEVQAILREIGASAAADLPGDEALRDDVVALLPFSKKAMAPYGADGLTDEQIATKPSDYPIRAALQRASVALRAHSKDDGLRLISTISAADLNAPKSQAKNNLTRLQRAPARRLALLEDILADLDKVAEQRSREKSPRWQSQFDLFRARMLSQYARIYEYNAVIGMVRKDALPDLDAKNGDVGWRMVCHETMQSGSEAKESARSAAKLYTKIIHDHPDTPWAVIARREKAQPMGLTWVPTADIPPPPPAPPKRK